MKQVGSDFFATSTTTAPAPSENRPGHAVLAQTPTREPKNPSYNSGNAPAQLPTIRPALSAEAYEELIAQLHGDSFENNRKPPESELTELLLRTAAELTVMSCEQVRSIINIAALPPETSLAILGDSAMGCQTPVQRAALCLGATGEPKKIERYLSTLIACASNELKQSAEFQRLTAQTQQSLRGVKWSWHAVKASLAVTLLGLITMPSWSIALVGVALALAGSEVADKREKDAACAARQLEVLVLSV